MPLSYRTSQEYTCTMKESILTLKESTRILAKSICTLIVFSMVSCAPEPDRITIENPLNFDRNGEAPLQITVQ